MGNNRWTRESGCALYRWQRSQTYRRRPALACWPRISFGGAFNSPHVGFATTFERVVAALWTPRGPTVVREHFSETFPFTAESLHHGSLLVACIDLSFAHPSGHRRTNRRTRTGIRRPTLPASSRPNSPALLGDSLFSSFAASRADRRRRVRGHRPKFREVVESMAAVSPAVQTQTNAGTFQTS